MQLIQKQRISLSLFFFLSGFNFSSWASRIPTIKQALDLNEAELGTILLTMPVSSLIGVPLSGWLVSRFETRIPLAVGFLLNSLALSLIGLAPSPGMLAVVLFLFSLSMRIFNISVNTQAITLQKQFDRKINGAFHGLWSTGGIVGVGFTTLLISLGVPMVPHLISVSVVSLLATVFTFGYLLKNDQSPSGNKLSFKKPDPYIMYLGLLVFFAAVCEGGMFDWSGIYFQEVVKEEVFTVGYLTFMTFMALSRFVSDKIIDRIGMATTYMLSGVFIFTGISLAILFPTFWPAMIGFSLVGFGTASVIPMTYTLAGASKTYSPGIAISLIATFGIVGMLIGPPMIGYLAHAFNLKISFIAFALAGLMLIPITRLFFKMQRSEADPFKVEAKEMA
ncbi:MFS transporter [Rufibacter glacialis]|uniref:MFS transporter n=1 Tax=Rufibacter glacialis TaxID=1259555 RepID=A0A5M8QB84_9BACT|nr:MFS transporter [Rufibacter glacialis]KAA6432418.1 MFS transporter [Rufibacter glacialis]GGK78513.1 MFS transporter [Rufibacter glacialis]